MKDLVKVDYSKGQYYTKADEPVKEETKTEDPGQSASLESEDSFKYEIDTRVLLEETYNNWLGRSKDGGVWKDDPFKKQMMKKELADKLIQSIRLKVNTHSLLSYYDEPIINKIAYETAKVWNEALMFSSLSYDLATEDYKVLIRVDVPFLIKQLLLSSINGRMMELRADRGKIHITRNEVAPSGGL